MSTIFYNQQFSACTLYIMIYSKRQLKAFESSSVSVFTVRRSSVH